MDLFITKIASLLLNEELTNKNKIAKKLRDPVS